MPQTCLEQVRRLPGMVCMPQTCLEQVRRLPGMVLYASNLPGAGLASGSYSNECLEVSHVLPEQSTD